MRNKILGRVPLLQFFDICINKSEEILIAISKQKVYREIGKRNNLDFININREKQKIWII